MFWRYKSTRVIFILALVFFMTGANASVESDFKQGVSYFNSGEYSSAVKKFESVRKQGVKSASLYYNLGSVYFKLKNYEMAEGYFVKLKNTAKMKYLAEYNLGLIAIEQNELDKARKYFKSVRDHSGDNKLVYLSRRQLSGRQLKKSELSVAEASSMGSQKNRKWSAYVNGSLGYDSNINFAPAGLGTEESATFFDAMVIADYLFSGTKSNGWTGDALLYTIRYSDTGNPNISKGAFDQDQYGVSLKKTQKMADWNMQFKVGLDKSTYGSRDYQSILSLHARGRKKLSRSDRIYLRYRYEDIGSDNTVFDYLEGWRQKIRGEFRRYNKKNSAQFYYELELNNRKDFVSGITGNEFSYSPTRHTFRGKYTAMLKNKAWRVTGDLAYRLSQYPSTPTQSRTDDRWKAAVYANYEFDRTMRLKLKFEYTDNTSTDNIYVYDRQLVSASLSKEF
ncbi:hypothetical protein MNBD_GAMMA09-2288 [hydrothermal vent metagenome]|uniref:Uncharacterized protein n=1 Tax=hydrothermal vent metagenome TaxID=652676 RepID=A0A3B0XGZ7_9ZZZZ